MASKQPLELTKLLESISGSEAFKADYEKFDAERRAAQEKLAFIQSKKRNTAAEKRQKKEQKVEAERHIKLQEDLVCSANEACKTQAALLMSYLIFLLRLSYTQLAWGG